MRRAELQGVCDFNEVSKNRLEQSGSTGKAHAAQAPEGH
jgi:hypothetical protein